MRELAAGDRKKRWGTYALAFFLPLAVIAAIFWMLHIYPFGEKTLVVWDANPQYVDFLVYLKKMLSGEVSLSYTFSKTLGGDLAGFTGYYLLSPFNLLVLFFEESRMPYAFQLIYVLKMMACGAACQYYWNSQNKPCRWSSVLFSTTYALSAYVFAYGYNIMWLDAVILLPFLARGIERLVETGRIRLYVLSLMGGLFTCYYMGYALCVFSVLYFLAQWCAYGKRNKKRVVAFVGASLLSAGLLGCVLIPMALSIQGGKAEFSLQGIWTGENYSLKALFRQWATGSFSTSDIPNPGLPPLFCGMLILWLVWLFFLSRRVDRKSKLVYGSLTFIILVSTWSRSLNLVWHAFSEPFGCAYRYSFLFSFLCVIMARRAWEAEWETEGTDRDWRPAAALIGAAACIVLAYFVSGIKGRYAAADLVLLLGFFGIAIWKQKKKLYGGALALTGVLMLADLGQNGKATWNLLIDDAKFDVQRYETHVETLGGLTERVMDLCGGSYRMELDYSVRRSYNDAMTFAYAGISHYSSAEKSFLDSLEEELGISTWREAESPDEFADSLLGLRYIVSVSEQIKSYECIGQEGEFRIFENPTALPLAFGTWEGEQWDDVLQTRDPWNWPQHVEPSDIVRERDDVVTFTIAMDESGEILTSIPWDAGWRISVDGENVPSEERWLDTFLRFAVGEGEHEIRLEYRMPGMSMGWAVTVLTAAAGILWFARKRKCAIIRGRQDER